MELSKLPKQKLTLFQHLFSMTSSLFWTNTHIHDFIFTILIKMSDCFVNEKLILFMNKSVYEKYRFSSKDIKYIMFYSYKNIYPFHLLYISESIIQQSINHTLYACTICQIYTHIMFQRWNLNRYSCNSKSKWSLLTVYHDCHH